MTKISQDTAKDALDTIVRIGHEVNQLAERNYQRRTHGEQPAPEDYTTPRPLDDWHEGMGDVLWWRFPITEPPYVGSPLDLGYEVEIVATIATGHQHANRFYVDGWPGYHTHWTPIPKPRTP